MQLRSRHKPRPSGQPAICQRAQAAWHHDSGGSGSRVRRSTANETPAPAAKQKQVMERVRSMEWFQRRGQGMPVCSREARYSA